MSNRVIPVLLTILVLTPLAAAQGWSSAVDPATPPLAKPRLDLKLTVPIKHKIETVVSDRPSPFVAICDANAFGPRAWGLLNLQTGGFTPGFAEKAAALEEAMLSPDGQYVAGKTRGERNAGAALEVWSFKTKTGLYRLQSGDNHWPPIALGFAAGDRLLSVTNLKFKPQLQAWDLKTGKKDWEVALPKMIESKNAAVSPGGKFLAAIVDGKLMVFETAKGAAHVEQGLPESEEKSPWGSQPKGVAFSTDGALLAAYCEHGHGKARLLVWDMATGNVVADKLSEMAKDDRWAKGGGRNLEFFGGGGGDAKFLRYVNHVIDRETGKAVYTIPPSKPGRGDDLYKVLGDDRVLIVSEKEQDRAHVSVAMLPKAEIDKSLAVVRQGGKSSDAGLPQLSKPDFTAIRTALETAPAGGAWSLKPDAPATKPPAFNAPVPIRAQRAPSGEDFAVKRVVFSGQPANQVAIAYHVTGKGGAAGPARRAPAAAAAGGEKKTLIERTGLAGAVSAGSLELPDHAELLDFAADGKSMLVRMGEDRVDLYSLATGPAKHIVGFRPYEGDQGGATVKAGGILSAEQFYTVSQSGRLVLWAAAGAKAVYEMATKSDDYELSPGRKQLAFANGEGVTIIDPAAGQVLAIIPGHRTWNDQLAFHPDGSRLAHFASQPYTHLMCYDMTTGKSVGDLTPPKESWTGPVVWAGAGHVMVGPFLADLDRRLVVWKYQRDGFAPKVTRQPDDRYWAFGRADFKVPAR